MPDKPKTHRFVQQAQPTAKAPSSSDWVWRKFRKQHAVNVPAICVDCQAALASESMELDHIISLEQGGARFDVNNLAWRCTSCHSKKTAKEDGGFGRNE